MTSSATPASSSSAAPANASFRERLLPGPGLFLTLLLIIPAVILLITPIKVSIAPYVAVATYLVISGSLALLSPTITVQGSTLTAGRASIPVALLGEIEMLDDAGLRRAIGPGCDARAHLLIRGYIHRAVRVQNIDPADPAPYWVLTTRKPQSLKAAIEAAR